MSAPTRKAPSVGGRRRLHLPAHQGVPDWILPVIGVAVTLAAFEIGPRLGIVSSRFFPPVSGPLTTLIEQLGTSGFWVAVGNTVQGWALGLGIAIAIAVPVGITVGSSWLLYRSLRGVIEFMRPVPSVALIPLAVLVFGTGLQSKVFLVAFASTWPVFIQTIYGVQNVDPVATDTARSFGLSRVQVLVRVTLPSAAPYIVTGIRISSAVALALAVTAELVIGSAGLGREINIARTGGAVDLMYALIIATGLLGWTLNASLARLERRILHWHPSHREAAAA